MAMSSDSAVVLRLTEFSETSQIAWLFTAQSGLVRLLAKGARRSTKTRIAVGLDLLEAGEVSFIPSRSAGALGTLAEWKQDQGHLELRRDPLRLYSGLYAAELIPALTEEYDPHPELYVALRALLAAISAEKSTGDEAAVEADPQSATIRTAPWAVVDYQRLLLQSIGFAPNLEACVDCGRVRPRGTAAFFSSRAGGLLCRNCEARHEEKRRVRAAVLDDAQTPSLVADWFALLDYHLTSTAGRPMRTADLLEPLLRRVARAAAGGEPGTHSASVKRPFGEGI